jgi:hypothetical protein
MQLWLLQIRSALVLHTYALQSSANAATVKKFIVTTTCIS